MAAVSEYLLAKAIATCPNRLLKVEKSRFLVKICYYNNLHLTVNNLVQFERQSGYFENVVANEGLTGHLVIDLSDAVYPTFSPRATLTGIFTN